MTIKTSVKLPKINTNGDFEEIDPNYLPVATENNIGGICPDGITLSTNGDTGVTSLTGNLNRSTAFSSTSAITASTGTSRTVMRGAVCLYANTSGSTGNITFPKAVSNYNMIEIWYTDGTRNYAEYIPSPKTNGEFSLSRTVYNSTNKAYYTAVSMYKWSSSGISFVSGSQGYFAEDNSCGNAGSGNQLKITQVFGWR